MDNLKKKSNILILPAAIIILYKIKQLYNSRNAHKREKEKSKSYQFLYITQLALNKSHEEKIKVI